MQITISARHGHLGEDAQVLVREKVEKLLHLFERLTMIEVTVDLKNEVKLVELQVEAEHKHDMVAKSEDRDLIHALEQAIHKMDGQIRRYKEKLQDHRRTPPVGEVAQAPDLEEASEE